MSRIARLTAVAALAATAFATAPASADVCTVTMEGQRFSLFGATWYMEYPVVDCGA